MEPTFLLVPGGVISVGSREPATTFIEGHRLPFVLEDAPGGSAAAAYSTPPSPPGFGALTEQSATWSARPGSLEALRRMLRGLDEAARAVDDAQRHMAALRDPALSFLLDALSSAAHPATPWERPWDSPAGAELPFALGIVDFAAPSSLAEASQPSPRRLRIRMLGRFEVEAGDRTLPPWRSHRARRLLAFLALNRRDDISRHRLMGLFWPEHSEERAENNLSLAVMALRRLIDAPSADTSLIGFRAGCYFIDAPDIWLDSEEFVATVAEATRLEAQGERSRAAEALDTALDLYAGDLLPAEVYEEWTEEPRRRLQDIFVDALQRRARLARESSDYDTSIALNRRLLECDPANEDAHRQLMRDYLVTGRRSRALAQMEACRQALNKHLGMDPQPETLTLFDRMRAGEGI